MKLNVEKLRKKYMANPPEEMTSGDIQRMSKDEFLDMDYFLNDDELDDDYGEEGFFSFLMICNEYCAHHTDWVFLP